LGAEGAAVFVIAHHEFFCHFVHHQQFNGIRRAIFDAQLTARAFGRIIHQLPAQHLRGWFPLEWVKLCDRAFEKRSENIA
jgi:hypothetical protein